VLLPSPPPVPSSVHARHCLSPSCSTLAPCTALPLQPPAAAAAGREGCHRDWRSAWRGSGLLAGHEPAFVHGARCASRCWCRLQLLHGIPQAEAQFVCAEAKVQPPGLLGCLRATAPPWLALPFAGFFVSGAQAAADAAAALGGAGEATDAAAAALGVTTVGVPAAAADQAGGEPLPAGETAAAAAAATVTAATGAAPEAASPVDSLAAGKPAAAPHGATVPTTKLA
jgi:hypothetical protein